MTGKGELEAAGVFRVGAVVRALRPLTTRRTLQPQKTQQGFSLLELMIAMFIMIILLSVAVPTYERSVRQARETVLRQNLKQMRASIDQYTADKGKLPKSIDDLVSDKYLRERPVDPILESDQWDEIQGDDPNSPDGGQGLKDVKSKANGNDSNDEPFSKY